MILSLRVRVAVSSFLLACAVALTAARPAVAQITFEVWSGTGFNLPTRLTIQQAGYPDISLTAHYSTRPLEDTPYFAGRVGFWKNNQGWIFDIVHHKLYLDNPPDEVQWFRVTYGFNLVTVGRGWRRGPLTWSASAGGVVTHASNSVRGRRYLGTGGPLNKGYTFSGVTITGGAHYRLGISDHAFISLGSLVSASYIEVQVIGGEAHVPAAALHLQGGVGVEF